jgi:hypothetical protein
MSKEHPILFNGDMVRAILDGKKTQTRRIIKAPPSARNGEFFFSIDGFPYYQVEHDGTFDEIPISNPCEIGSILWVRETWNMADEATEIINGESIGPSAPYRGVQGNRKITWRAVYSADHPGGEHPKFGRPRWRPSIHMPRWACRLFLEVTNVRVERLQDISQEDALAEGVQYVVDKLACCKDGTMDSHFQMELSMDHVKAFSYLWDSINAKRGYGWDENVFVWVIDFKKIKGEHAWLETNTNTLSDSKAMTM